VLTLTLYLLAFLSGFAALVYQVAWARILSLTFGGSTLAVSAVVASFMGGMGIGAWLYHRAGDRVGSAIRTYAYLEYGIALSTAGFTLLFIGLPEWFAFASHHVAGSAMIALRVFTVFVLLLVPAALMGATYPALCSAMIHSRKEVDRHLGWVYGFNTIGGAAGAMAAGFLFVEFLGSQGSVLAANLINLFVASCALLLARSQAKSAVGPADATTDESVPTDLPHWLTGTVLFFSGFATLGYEMVWFRALRYLLGNGTYVLSAALVIFLLGLGLGGLLYRPALRFGRPEWNLGFCQLGIAIFALVAIGSEQFILATPILHDHLSVFSATLRTQHWIWRVAVGSGVAMAIMLPATLWMGLCFPLASRLFLGSVGALSSRVGLAYLLSNLGSISGAILAAVWIIPSWGTVGGTKLLAGLNIALAVLVLHRGASRLTRFVTAVGIVAALVLVLVLPSGLSFRGESVTFHGRDPRLLYAKEADLGTVYVMTLTRQPDSLTMLIDGIVIGGNREFSELIHDKQILLAHLPMALDRNIRSTLSLGVATASTLRTLSRYPWVEVLEAVEINPAVIEGSSAFPDSIVLLDSRTRLFVEDAIHHLLRTPDRFDLIVSDAKQNIDFTGTARILTQDFYRIASSRLEPCGLFAQSIFFNNEPKNFQMMLRTFRSVFPEMEVFALAPAMAILVGSRCPISGRPRPTGEDLEKARVAKEIAMSFLPDPTAIPTLWVMGGADVDEFVEPGPVNTWDRTAIEFASYRAYYSSKLLTQNQVENLRFLVRAKAESRRDAPDFTRHPLRDSMTSLNRAHLNLLELNRATAGSLFSEILDEHPSHSLARRGREMAR
jgi:spermidine synthase